VHRFLCYDNIVPNAKCQRVLVLTLCLVCFTDFSFSALTMLVWCQEVSDEVLAWLSVWSEV